MSALGRHKSLPLQIGIKKDTTVSILQLSCLDCGAEKVLFRFRFVVVALGWFVGIQFAQEVFENGQA